MTCYTTNSFEGKIIKLKLKLKWGTCCLAFFFDLLVKWGVGMKASIIIYIYIMTRVKKFLCSLLKSMAIINNCFPFIYIIVNIMKTNKK